MENKINRKTCGDGRITTRQAAEMKIQQLVKEYRKKNAVHKREYTPNFYRNF